METIRHSGPRCGACEVRGDLTWTPPGLCESNFNATASGVSWYAARNGSTAPSVRSSLRPFQGAVLFSGRIPRSVTRFYRCRRDRSLANALARERCPRRFHVSAAVVPRWYFTSRNAPQTRGGSRALLSLMHGLELSRSC